jgi:hypothetical protein
MVKDKKAVMSVKDIQIYTGLCRSTIMKNINNSNLNTIFPRRSGSKMLFLREDVIKYFKSTNK